MSYTSITIGGVDLFVDPDSISVSTEPIVAIDKSLAGETYVTTVKSNTPAKNRTISISGAYLPASNAAALVALAEVGAAVSITGGIVGTSGAFIITSCTCSPTKPLPIFPGDSTVKHQYSLTLVEVS